MKKLLACILGGLLLLGVFATPVASEMKTIQKIEKEDSKFVHLFVASLYDEDYYDLVVATIGMKEGDHLKLTIMSPGGPALPMLAMLNHVESLKAKGVYVSTKVAGLAGSGGAMIWITGDTRIISKGDLMMFHTSVVRGPYGNVDIETLPPEGQFIIREVNHAMRQYLLDILHDTELVNELLSADGNKEGETNENWYNAKEIFKMGLATELQ